MPRLRKLKNYDQLTCDSSWEESSYEADATNAQAVSDEAESLQESDTVNASGVSWLSNASVVAGLSDAKLREWIVHYRHLLAVLTDELVARASHSRAPYVRLGDTGPARQVVGRRAAREVRLSKLIRQAEDLGVPTQLIKEILKK
jgi:hypothetical protein